MGIYLIMDKIMMIYSIPKGDSILRINFNRKLFNYNVQSHKGKYKRKTKGILSKVEKPAKSCVIFDKGYLKEVRKLCKDFNIKYKLYLIKKLR